jgi:hypothetical protein
MDPFLFFMMNFPFKKRMSVFFSALASIILLFCPLNETFSMSAKVMTNNANK